MQIQQDNNIRLRAGGLLWCSRDRLCFPQTLSMENFVHTAPNTHPQANQLTFFWHAYSETFLVSTQRTIVSTPLLYGTVIIPWTFVLNIFLFQAATEKALKKSKNLCQNFLSIKLVKIKSFSKVNMTCIKNAIYKVFDKLCLHFTSQNNLALGGMQS